MSGVVASQIESCGALVENMRQILFLHSLQASDRQSFFLRNAGLALWGNVSCATFREKLRTCGGSCWTAEDQTSAALSSVARRSWPWCSSPLACCSLLCASFSMIVLLVRAFLLVILPGVSRYSHWLELFGWPSSFSCLIPSVAVCRTVGSVDVRIWHAREAHCFW